MFGKRLVLRNNESLNEVEYRQRSCDLSPFQPLFWVDGDGGRVVDGKLIEDLDSIEGFNSHLPDPKVSITIKKVEHTLVIFSHGTSLLP